jgi:hypothetical protein
MDLCVCIQCFNKPIETILVLKSLEKCKEVSEINLVLFIDKATSSSKSFNKNKELIDVLINYKNYNQKLYSSIQIILSDKNLGPYKACCECIDKSFEKYNYVIFSEDDILFCRDTIKYFKKYFNSDKYKNDPNCIGISSSSIYFGFNNKSSFVIDKNNITPNDIYKQDIKLIKEKVSELNISNSFMKLNWAPNKQFGLIKENWKKIKFFRTDNYILNKELYTKAPDFATGVFVKENNYYFLFSFIPRSNDIGLYNEIGCTTLYYNDVPKPDTIKYLTSDDFETDEVEFSLIENDLLEIFNNFINKYKF